MLDHRRRRCVNIKPALRQRLMFTRGLTEWPVAIYREVVAGFTMSSCSMLINFPIITKVTPWSEYSFAMRYAGCWKPARGNEAIREGSICKYVKWADTAFSF